MKETLNLDLIFSINIFPLLYYGSFGNYYISSCKMNHLKMSREKMSIPLECFIRQ